MANYCSFGSCREACAAIVDVAKQRKHMLVQRPWNYHDPDNTAWWLVSSTDWPAYRHGKFFFEKVEGQSDALLCGLYVEKGIGAELRDVYTSVKERRCIMQPDWAWFRLLRDFRSGRLEAMITKLSSNINSTIELRIDGSYLTDTGIQFFDPYNPSLDQISSKFSYTFRLGSDSRIVAVTKSTDSMVEARLSDVLSTVGTISDFRRAIEELNRNPWLWVDVFIALQFDTLPPSGLESGRVWGPSAIWDKFLSSFLPWL